MNKIRVMLIIVCAPFFYGCNTIPNYQQYKGTPYELFTQNVGGLSDEEAYLNTRIRIAMKYGDSNYRNHSYISAIALNLGYPGLALYSAQEGRRIISQDQSISNSNQRIYDILIFNQSLALLLIGQNEAAKNGLQYLSLRSNDVFLKRRSVSLLMKLEMNEAITLEDIDGVY